MSIYKQITDENVSTSEVEIYSSQSFQITLTSVDPEDYTNSQPWCRMWRNYSQSYEDITLLTVQYGQDMYNSLKKNFYLSGSNYAQEEIRFNSPYFKKGPEYNRTNPQYYHKFHSASSDSPGTHQQQGLMFSIPQQNFGKYIKPGTFKLIKGDAWSTELTIVDDGYGNLYSTDATVSKSAGHLSSSDNYVGNIFYRSGVAVLTAGNEKYSGSSESNANYYQSMVETGAIQGISCSFLSVKDVYVTEYSLNIEPNEFNVTNNPSAKLGQTGSSANYLAAPLTGSSWSPYFNTVGFYDDENRLVAKATYPQNIKTRRDIPITLNIKIDW